MKISTINAIFTTYPNREWVVDFNTGDNGEPDSTLDAVAQDIRFALSTERYKYPIMGANFGATFDDLVGSDYNYIRSEIARRIKDALSTDDRVISIEDFVFKKQSNDAIFVSCVVKTNVGDVPISTIIAQ